MQLRELILLLLLVLVVAVIAVVVPGRLQAEGGPHSQTEHVGSQAEWLDAGDRAELCCAGSCSGGPWRLCRC